MSQTEPKTREEILQERLQEINSKLTTFKTLIGTCAEKHAHNLVLYEKRRKDSKGTPKFVRVSGNKLVEATDRLEAMLQIEESLETLIQLEGKDPVKETEKLLAHKIRILKELLPHSKEVKSIPKG